MGREGGLRFWTMPQAKNTIEYDGRSVCKRCNTCEICPTGARYSPEFTLQRLLAQKKIVLHDRTLVRRLVLHDTRATVAKAVGSHYDRPGEETEYHARCFVVASGYAWSPYLLLLSACSRFPQGLANGSGLVGRYMSGHRWIWSDIELDLKLYPGMNVGHGLLNREFFRSPPDKPFVRHDLKIRESRGHPVPLRDAAGRPRLGDDLLAAWRARGATRGLVRVNALADMHPARESGIRPDPTRRNRFGDPLPRIDYHFDEATEGRRASTHAHFEALFARMARANDGRPSPPGYGAYPSHPAGGCRMGVDPRDSVCDSYGRTHDHSNLYVVGAPTLPTSGCTNGTLTFAAVTLRSADRIAEELGAPAPPRSD